MGLNIQNEMMILNLKSPDGNEKETIGMHEATVKLMKLRTNERED